MNTLYREDLAYIQATAFGELARSAALEIVRRLRSARIPVRRVVDVGCGAGPLTVALLKAGFETTGIDSSAELLAIARVHAPTARFLHASAYQADIRACEAIIGLGEPLTYHEEAVDADNLVRGFIQRAAAVLPPGGVLIFDVIERGQPSLTARVWMSGENWAVLVDTQEDPTTQSLIRSIETFRRVGELYRRGREHHRVHVFDAHAIRSELEGSGFEVETANAYGAYMLPPRRLAFFATKTGRV